MRSLTILVAVISMSFSLKTDNLNTCNGFGKFVFGAPRESFANLTLEITEGSLQLYHIDTKEVNIPGVDFEYIRLSFIHNKLTAIAMLTKNSTRENFLGILKEKYGVPTKRNGNYEWSGKYVRIVYEPYKNSRDAAIDFYRNATK